VDRIRDEKYVLARAIRSYLDAGFSVPPTTMRSPLVWERNFNGTFSSVEATELVAPIGPDLPSFVARSPWDEMRLFRLDVGGARPMRSSEEVRGAIPPSV